jgi:D-alanyl-D-alanine carboxypeptidase/D-alanyl-D-alanine-endopeptidase (penicillin-binding protein 4)
MVTAGKRTEIMALRRPIGTLTTAIAIGLAAALAVSNAARAETKRTPSLAVGVPGNARSLIAEAGLEGSRIGYVVYDLRAHRRLAARAADELFVPASVAKVPTTVAALEILGPDYRFHTDVYASRPPEKGTEPGDLYLVGGGDPMLTGDHMQAMVRALRREGLSRVSGRFLYDETMLPPAEIISRDQPNYAPHNSGVSALTVNFNRVEVDWLRRGKDGQTLETRVTSNTDRRKTAVDTVRLFLGAPAQHLARAFTFAGFKDGERWMMSPYLRRRGRIWLPVKRPAPTAAAVFRGLAAQAGLALPHAVAGALPKGATLIHRHRSEKLTRSIRRLMLFSNNVAAELIGLSTTRRLAGHGLTLGKSAQALTAWLKARMPGTDWRGFHLANHSGLSLAARISPAQMLAVLDFAHDRRYGRYRYPALLKRYPLSRRVAPHGRYSVRAKSGTMNYVRGHAGYIRTVSGRELAFVVFINQIGARGGGAVHKVGAKHRRYGPRTWMARARKLEQALVASWVRSY